ncbi:histidine kinase [Chitinophaga pinensis DSM 2588]|uniref:Histidine kinase n=1 Tax=Chitinophaga pinensis (strain ATCC 43595 / DSM 2588 / LMG 13176 / NBRC 15968 / NCIMB 11800 / UQM 2034) TaxID=485918 RepID=A0A979G6G3_CHIPD|nr:histidine kinase [Chitinophaga pinensis DSM 2588]
MNSIGQKQEFIPFRSYSQSSGLTSYNITKILQDKFGFIWIGTQDGLNCFDGKNFLIFNRETNSRRTLHGNNVTDITEDTARHLIWVATSYGGPTGIGTISHVVSHQLSGTAQTVLADKWVRSLAIRGKMMAIGTYEGLYMYDLESGRIQLSASELNVSKLLTDASGNIWAFCDNHGVLIINGNTGRPLTNITLRIPNLLFWDVTINGHVIYAATSKGLKKFDVNRMQLVNTEMGPFLPDEEFFSCAADNKGQLWVANAHSLYRYNGSWSRIKDVNFEVDSWQSAIYEIFIDREGNTWLGSQEGLAYLSNQRRPFEKYYRSIHSSVKIQHAFSIFNDDNKAIYCGAANGLYQVHPDSRSIERIDSSSSNYLVTRLPDQEILVSNSKGCAIVRQQQLIPVGEVYPSLRALQPELLSSAVQYNDSVMVFGSQLHKGLYIWNTRARTLRVINGRNSKLRLDNDIINALYKDKKGQLWVLSEEQLFLLDPLTDSCTSFRFQRILFDMCETSNGYWIAAYGTGIIETDRQLRVRRIISAKEGLSNNGVYKIFPYRDSLIAVTSNNGLSVLDISGKRIRNYYQQDGLHSSGFEQFCGTRDKQSFYAGGVNGFTQVFPAYFSVNHQPPALYITRVNSETRNGILDTTDLQLSSIEIPNNVLQTTINFAALNFQHPESTTYSYRIAEQEGGWINLGSQHFLNFTGMQPGKYTLLLRAANEDGYWTPEPVRLTLIFLPKWYQTNWFKGMILLMIGGIFYALYRYRLAQLKKQVAIRTGIASDLHDDLGSTLNSVKVLTHLAKREPEQPEHLNQIENAITQAAAGLRDLIWVLDDAQDTIYELSERIRKFALPLTNAHHIQLECIITAESNDLPISKTQKRNLYLIAKEAINNSIKYADCDRIQVVLRQGNKSVSLRIEDNGKGFEMTSVQRGNGLRNIVQRAKQMNTHADIYSKPGEGTIIHIV